MSELTKSICWELQVIKKDTVNGVGAAIYRKPTSNECYNKRSENEPPLCKDSDDPNAAWYILLSCPGFKNCLFPAKTHLECSWSGRINVERIQIIQMEIDSTELTSLQSLWMYCHKDWDSHKLPQS